MKDRIYALHGTSLQNALSILKNGFKPTIKNWSVASDRCYLFKSDDATKNEEFAKAMTQGLTACYKLKHSCRPAVILVDITGIDYIPDDPIYCPDILSSIQIECCYVKDNIKGIYSAGMNVAWAKLISAYHVYTNGQQNTLRLSSREKKLSECLEYAKIKNDTLKYKPRKVYEIAHNYLHIPHEALL